MHDASSILDSSDSGIIRRARSRLNLDPEWGRLSSASKLVTGYLKRTITTTGSSRRLPPSRPHRLGVAIHHLRDERKRSLHGEIFDLPATGGLFVNIEHVAIVPDEVEALYDAAYIHYISFRTGETARLWMRNTAVVPIRLTIFCNGLKCRSSGFARSASCMQTATSSGSNWRSSAVLSHEPEPFSFLQCNVRP